MKVKELIAKLKKAEPSAEVLVYSDAEGNNLHGLGEVFAPIVGPAVYIYPDDQYLDEPYLEDEDGIS